MTDNPSNTMSILRVLSVKPVMQLDLSKTHREWVFTNSLAGFGRRVNLVTLLTLAFVTADLVDADLAACVWVGTLVDICYTEKEQKSNEISIDHHDRSEYCKVTESTTTTIALRARQMHQNKHTRRVRIILSN